MDWYPKRRFGDLADEIADRLPDAEGLVFEEARYTFRQVAQRINDAAKRLIAAGVGLGDHVALWLNNCDAWIFVAFAVHKIGAVLVPINTRFRARDMAYVLRQSDARFLIIEERSGSIDYLAMVRDAVSLPKTGNEVHDAAFPELRQVILLDAQAQAGTVAWPALEKTAAAVSDSTLATRAGIVDPDAPTFHHVHLGYHRVSQGGGAQPQTDPQRRGAHLPDGDHAQQRDP
jgi:fatty-acyl-CoA synthase